MPPNESSIFCVVSLWYQIEKNIRNNARPQPSLGSHSWELQSQKWECRDRSTYTQNTVNKRVHKMLTWKTLRGKNHGSPQMLNYHYVKRIQQGGTEATTSCSHSSPGGGYNRESLCVSHSLSLSFSLSLSLSLSLCVTLCIAVTPNNSIHHHTLFALGYIYTNMTFGLFTNIVTNRLTETYFHLCRLHLVRGSQWACVIRFSPGLSLPGTHIPSGGTEIVIYETSRWLKYGAVLLADPIYASWHSWMRLAGLINFLSV